MYVTIRSALKGKNASLRGRRSHIALGVEDMGGWAEENLEHRPDRPHVEISLGLYMNLHAWGIQSWKTHCACGRKGQGR